MNIISVTIIFCLSYCKHNVTSTHFYAHTPTHTHTHAQISLFLSPISARPRSERGWYFGATLSERLPPRQKVRNHACTCVYSL